MNFNDANRFIDSIGEAVLVDGRPILYATFRHPVYGEMYASYMEPELYCMATNNCFFNSSFDRYYTVKNGVVYSNTEAPIKIHYAK